MSKLNPSPDFILYTDGSGREQDGYSGYAALVKDPSSNHKRFVMGCMSGSTTDRAEFTALLEGLRLCQEMLQNRRKKSLHEVRPAKARICWYSDRESLVLSVQGVYSRKNSPDLWASFEYYESIFEIDAHSVTEPFTETEPEFVEVDLQSSTGREIIKHYFNQTPLNVDPQPVTRSKKASGTDQQNQ